MPFPSEDQSLVINHRTSPLIVVAGPGTGKTRTLVSRMISLLREDLTQEVTIITFTRASRRDTENKLLEVFGEVVLENPDLMFPRTSTLHTYAKRLVHRFAHLIARDSSFSILIEKKGERSLIIDEIMSDLGLTLDHERLSKSIKEKRSTGEWPLNLALQAAERAIILERLDVLLSLYRTFDMEGVVLAACGIMQAPGSILPRIFLQVDEYQDLNPIDQQFIELLSSHPDSEVVVVGDDAQSIYGLRYANYEGVKSLWNSNSWDTIRFPDSFRLPSHILNAALDLIRDRGYIGADINQKPPTEFKIVTLQCTKHYLQYEAISRDIRARINNQTNVDGLPLSYKNFLILCPVNTKVEQCVSALNDRFDIPTHIPRSSLIPDDYWTVILFLRIAYYSDPLALRQWLPILGFTQDKIRALRDMALDEGNGFFDYCLTYDDPRIHRLQADIEGVRNNADTAEALIASLSSIGGISVPVELRNRFDSIAGEDGNLPNLGHILQFIYEHFGVYDTEEQIPEEDSVLVTTMHRVKGLEADFVYCTWMNSTFMPMASRDPEEERRVLYVALTRAKQDVIITFPEGYDRHRRRPLGLEAISPYLSEIAGHLDIIRATASVVRMDPLPWH